MVRKNLMPDPEIATSRPIFETRQMLLGQFICPTTAPNFSDTGPIRNGPIVVFPRIGVEITHAGHAPMVQIQTLWSFIMTGRSINGAKCRHTATDAIGLRLTPQLCERLWASSTSTLEMRNATYSKSRMDPVPTEFTFFIG